MSYPDSLRQQAKWVREALDPSTPETQRITLDDIDVEELEAAASYIEHLRGSLEKCKGYMWNARIDLETGTKRAGIATITGGIAMVDNALEDR